MLLFANGKPPPSEMQARGTTKPHVVFQEHVLPAKYKKLYPVQSLPTWSPIAFHDSVEGVTMLPHASGVAVSIPGQRPLPWLGDGDPVVIGQPAARLLRKTDPSKLDQYGCWFFDKAIPLEILDRVVAEVETFLIDQWDPILQQYPSVHRGPHADDRRILSARLPGTGGGTQYSDITYDDLPTTTHLSNFILPIINKALDCKHVLYNSAHVAAQGHERLSVHRHMHKNPGGLCTLTVFCAENYDLDANDKSDTIIIPGNGHGLPQPCDPVLIHLRRGNFFVASFRSHSCWWSSAHLPSVRFLAQSGIAGPCQFPGHISICVGDVCPILRV